ncbi:hypothetical protein [Aeromonas sp. S16(2024)]|uniref:hypothetical protein n=1 Tax=Aeromonas sp. S16(2024) TaxID=3242889 RepID=UPI003528F6A8
MAIGIAFAHAHGVITSLFCHPCVLLFEQALQMQSLIASDVHNGWLNVPEGVTPDREMQGTLLSISIDDLYHSTGHLNSVNRDVMINYYAVWSSGPMKCYLSQGDVMGLNGRLTASNRKYCDNAFIFHDA